MANVELRGINHIGIRVRELERSREFYHRLGFELVWHSETHRVAGLRNAAGVELNLIINSDDDNGGKNILMDVAPKYPGYTHASFRVPSMVDPGRALGAEALALRRGPTNPG